MGLPTRQRSFRRIPPSLSLPMVFPFVLEYAFLHGARVDLEVSFGIRKTMIPLPPTHDSDCRPLFLFP